MLGALFHLSNSLIIRNWIWLCCEKSLNTFNLFIYSNHLYNFLFAIWCVGNPTYFILYLFSSIWLLLDYNSFSFKQFIIYQTTLKKKHLLFWQYIAFFVLFSIRKLNRKLISTLWYSFFFISDLNIMFRKFVSIREFLNLNF